jgi:hypothetical protein
MLSYTLQRIEKFAYFQAIIHQTFTQGTNVTVCSVAGAPYFRTSAKPLFSPGILLSVQRLAAGWTVRESNPSWGEIFCTRPDRLLGPTSLLHSRYRVYFRRLKGLGLGVVHPHTSSFDIKERVEL